MVQGTYNVKVSTKVLWSDRDQGKMKYSEKIHNQ